MPELEDHRQAWHRCYQLKKSSSNKDHSRWSDPHCAVRLRGYSELMMGNIEPKFRKRIDTALRRGYMLEYNSQLPNLLRYIERYNPVQDVAIGYVGKTEFQVYMPTSDQADALKHELHAVTVMTDAFKANKINTPAINRGMWPVTCRVNKRENNVSLKASDNHTAHLISAFKELRPTIDDYMKEWSQPREEVARWALDDASVIRIPFDSHKDRGNV